MGRKIVGDCGQNCDTGNVTQNRDVWCVQEGKRVSDINCNQLTKPKTSQPCANLSQCSRFFCKHIESEDSDCSKDCDGGQIRRAYKCWDRDLDKQAVSENLCQPNCSEATPKYDVCNTQPCDNNHFLPIYYLKYSDFGACLTEDGFTCSSTRKGVRTKTVTCMAGGHPTNLTNCEQHGITPDQSELTEDCDLPDCSEDVRYQWKIIRELVPCTHKCAGYTKKVLWGCFEISDQDDKGNPKQVQDSFCGTDKPSETQSCGNSICHDQFDWFPIPHDFPPCDGSSDTVQREIFCVDTFCLQSNHIDSDSNDITEDMIKSCIQDTSVCDTEEAAGHINAKPSSSRDCNSTIDINLDGNNDDSFTRYYLYLSNYGDSNTVSYVSPDPDSEVKPFDIGQIRGRFFFLYDYFIDTTTPTDPHLRYNQNLNMRTDIGTGESKLMHAYYNFYLNQTGCTGADCVKTTLIGLYWDTSPSLKQDSTDEYFIITPTFYFVNPDNEASKDYITIGAKCKLRIDTGPELYNERRIYTVVKDNDTEGRNPLRIVAVAELTSNDEEYILNIRTK